MIQLKLTRQTQDLQFFEVNNQGDVRILNSSMDETELKNLTGWTDDVISAVFKLYNQALESGKMEYIRL